MFRKRALDVCRDKNATESAQAEIQARIKRIRGNRDLYQPFQRVLQVDAWLQQFQAEQLRYPVLVLLGASRTKKTEFAKSLFKNPLELKLGALEHFPEKMRQFDRNVHDGVVLDDLRDFQFLVTHQDKLQGKYDSLVEFASTPGGQLAYSKDLYAVPLVVTANFDTANQTLLQTSDWLSNGENVVLVRYPPLATPA